MLPREHGNEGAELEYDSGIEQEREKNIPESQKAKESEVTSPDKFENEQREENELRNHNLKLWFAKSKMVDDEGRPKVYYHGTGKEFEVFDKSFQGKKADGTKKKAAQHKLGFFFASHKEYGAFYGYVDQEPMNVYLKIEKPYDMPSREFLDLDTDDKVSKFLHKITMKGYDGLNIEDGTEIVVFESVNIKSVNNRGTFDPNDPNIFH